VPEAAVADTGPLLHLAEIGEAVQLCVFDVLSVSNQVNAELVRHGVLGQITSALGDRLQVLRVRGRELQAQALALSGFRVHRTDLSTAALAERLGPDVVLTDDLELRKGLESRGHTVVGSIGVLFRAFETGRIPKADLMARLNRLLNGSSLYTSRGIRITLDEIVKNLPDS
jgi:predicted nucleic acid-binding protein